MLRFLFVLWIFCGWLHAQTQDLYINAGFRRLEDGDYESALVYLNKAVQVEPGRAKGYYQRAILKTRKGDLKSAMADLDTALLREPDFSPVYLLRARVYEGIQQREMALREVSRYILQNPRDLSGYEFKIELLQKEKSDRSALLTADDMVSNNPDLAPGWKLRGQLREAQLDGPGALQDYSRCLELTGRDSLCLIRRANLRFDMGDAPGAAADYTAFLTQYPDNTDWWVNLSEARAIIKDTLGAIRALDSALLKRADDPALFLSRGYFLLTQKKYEPAEMDYIRALDLNTEEQGIAWFNKGLSIFYQGRKEDACQDWKLASTTTPPVEDALVWIKKHCGKP